MDSLLSSRTKMERQRNLFLSLSALALLSQNLLLPAATAAAGALGNQKNYYSPPQGGHPPPSPSTPGGGGSCSPAPPSPGGGYHPSPPSTPTHRVPPPSPAAPVKPSPPVPVKPSPPVPVHPGFGPFPCTYWGSHPGMIWGVLGWWGTVGGVFGVASLPGTSGLDPSSFTLQHALTNTRPGGYNALYRHAAASFLNALAAPDKFPFTASHVRSAFASALGSDKAAASQARLFRLANEGRLKLV